MFPAYYLQNKFPRAAQMEANWRPSLKLEDLFQFPLWCLPLTIGQLMYCRGQQTFGGRGPDEPPTNLLRAGQIKTSQLKPNTHRRRRRDETVESRRVGGVYTNSQLVGDSFVVSSV